MLFIANEGASIGLDTLLFAFLLFFMGRGSVNL
jgi:hypothetical protein